MSFFILKLISCLGGFAFLFVFLGSVPIYLLLFLLVEVVFFFRALVCYGSVISSILLIIYLIVYVGAIMVIFGYVCSLLPTLPNFSSYLFLLVRVSIFRSIVILIGGLFDKALIHFSRVSPLDISAFIYQSSFIFVFI